MELQAPVSWFIFIWFMNLLAEARPTNFDIYRPFSDLKYTVPEARCSDSPDALFVLATAIRCCTFVPDLCAPTLLLSTLDLISENRTTGSDTSSKSARVVGKDNLLPVFLDIVVQLAQVNKYTNAFG